MIQLIINTQLLREIDERRLINTYARLFFKDMNSVEIDAEIEQNLKNLLDWDYAGSKGLGIYCSKFERIKRADLHELVAFIKYHASEIEFISRRFVKKKTLENNKEILKARELKEHKLKENYLNKTEYIPHKKAKPCVYKGRQYKSVRECMYCEDLTKAEVYKYLALTGQMDPDSPTAKKYLKK